MEASIWVWLGFFLFLVLALIADLGFFHKKSHSINFREAFARTLAWVALAIIFAAGIFYFEGGGHASEFLAGYLIEYSLSLDNIFVFVLIFSYFNIPPSHQHRILFWGILGALILRGAMIGLGAALVTKFHWILYIFGIFLVYTGIKITREKTKDIDPEKNPLIILLERFLPIAKNAEGEKFFTKIKGRIYATPIFLVLLMVEMSDVIFAIDSIPAIFSVTTDPFIVFTANIFAIMGLRSLYFLLARLVTKFFYLKTALSFILIFIGGKMLAAPWYNVSTTVTLAVILSLIISAIGFSIIRNNRSK